MPFSLPYFPSFNIKVELMAAISTEGAMDKVADCEIYFVRAISSCSLCQPDNYKQDSHGNSKAETGSVIHTMEILGFNLGNATEAMNLVVGVWLNLAPDIQSGANICLVESVHHCLSCQPNLGKWQTDLDTKKNWLIFRL